VIRWYLSPYSGKGTWDDPFHAAAWDVINPENDKCVGFIHKVGESFIVRIEAPYEVHNKIILERKGEPITKLCEGIMEEKAELTSIDVSLPIANKLKSSQLDWITKERFR